ncbi:MAG: hypothetical protein U1D30_15935 [Planctomycetota bacterium]
MTTVTDWRIAEPNVDTVLANCSHPLESLAQGEIPAIVLRGTYPQKECERLIEHLIAEGHLYDPSKPVPHQFLERNVPEGHYQKERKEPAEKTWRDDGSSPKRRIDIGTSLGNLGFDKERFLEHAEETHRLFARLFDRFENPVELLYRSLERLAKGKSVRTAEEPGGRKYGPAIIRAHYGGYTYKPHFDSVRLREDRKSYSVFHFEHQFAGVLVLQNSERDGVSAQCRLHRCLWQPEIEPHLTTDTFHQYAAENAITNVDVNLAPGDLYFFNTRSIHEVPGVAGVLPRIVLATFIGYSSDRPELFVWS